MPKERMISLIPKDRLVAEMKQEMGLQDTQVNPGISTIKDLVVQ
jgi:hypothetical protein